jgi:hypothetical protein
VISLSTLIVIAATVALLFVILQPLDKTYLPQPLDASMQLENAITKAADFAGTTYDHGKFFAPGGVGQAMGAVVETTALDSTTGDETYKFVVQESEDGNTWNDAGPIISVTAVGFVTVPAFISKRYNRLNLDVGGTTPSITYSAYLHPNVAAG